MPKKYKLTKLPGLNLKGFIISIFNLCYYDTLVYDDETHVEIWFNKNNYRRIKLTAPRNFRFLVKIASPGYIFKSR